MSVINQMLKDLDNRQSGQVSAEPIENSVIPTRTSRRMIVLGSLLVIFLAIITWYFIQLNEENERLKKQITDSASNVGDVTFESKNKAIETPSLVTEVTQPLKEVNQNTLNNEDDKVLAVSSSKPLLTKANDVVDQSKTSEETSLPPNTVQISEGPTDNAKKNRPNTKLPNESTPEAAVNVPNKPLSSLSISRRQLSANELAAQKLSQAKQAMANNDLNKAETLFEDILLVTPQHKSARVQLAALWFGKKQYQPALNLLTQGINMSPSDADFRLMKAKVLLTVNQVDNALKTLSALPTATSIEYQSLLANTAQQTKRYDLTISAYKQLTQLQPTKGKWWLGLAIAYDSDGQFTQARETYQQALAQGSLSQSAITFIQQRLGELGE